MYLKSTELMDRYQISRSTVYRILKEMQESNRYPPNAIIGVGKRKRISVEAFQDYYTEYGMAPTSEYEEICKAIQGGLNNDRN